MLYLKVITKDGNTTEYLNAQHILSIKPYGENLKYFKILMGAGLYWYVEADTIEIVELDGILGGKQNEQLSKAKGKGKVKGG